MVRLSGQPQPEIDYVPRTRLQRWRDYARIVFLENNGDGKVVYQLLFASFLAAAVVSSFFSFAPATAFAVHAVVQGTLAARSSADKLREYRRYHHPLFEDEHVRTRLARTPIGLLERKWSAIALGALAIAPGAILSVTVGVLSGVPLFGLAAFGAFMTGAFFVADKMCSGRDKKALAEARAYAAQRKAEAHKNVRHKLGRLQVKPEAAVAPTETQAAVAANAGLLRRPLPKVEL